MSRLHLLILWVLALIAGAIVFSVKGTKHQASHHKTSLAQGDEIVSKGALQTSGGLRITKGEETASLLLKGNSWVVSEQTDYPVNISTLGSAFDAVRGLKVVQGLTASPDNWERFGLSLDAEKENNRPKVVTLLAEDGSDAQTIYVGKQTEGGGGQFGGGNNARFIRLAGDDQSIYIVDESFSALNSDSLTWIDKQLPKIENPLKVTVDREAGDDWTVSRKTAIGDMILEDLTEDEETVVAQTAPLKTLFSSSQFIELLTPEEVEKRSAVGESRTVTVETASGITYVYDLIPEKNEDPKEDDDEKGPAQQDNRNYMISFKLTSGPKAPAKPAETASEADKAGYQALLANMKSAEKNYTKHKALEGRHYLVGSFVVNPVTKDRGTLRQKKKPKQEVVSPAISVPGTPKETPKGSPTLPGGVNGQRPATGVNKPRKRIEAVTPPIAIPQIPKKKEDKKEE